MNSMADAQDPLAALQQLLDEQKQQTTTSGGDAPQDVPQEPPLPTGPTAEEIAVLSAQKEAEDRERIAEQLNRMQQELKDTPQYQARMSQKLAGEEEQKRKHLEERSQRIVQLKRLDT